MAAQVEVGIAPGVQLGGAAQGLAGTGVGCALLGVVDQQDSGFEAALQLAQEGEQGRDIGGGVFIDAVQADEGIEDE